MSPKNCCGEKRKTHFCPECGRKLNERTEIDEVIVHFALQRKKAMASAAAWRCGNLNKGKTKEYCDKRAASADESAKKFTSWIEALRQLKVETGR